MDDYSSDVSKFYEGDWAQFRSQLSLLGVQTVIDLAASADIEDIFCWIWMGSVDTWSCLSP